MGIHEQRKRMKDIDICGSPTRRWGYEQAFATSFIFKCPRDEWRDMENFLESQFNCNPENKVTYEITRYKEAPYYITFHDNTVYVGLGIRPYGHNPLTKGQEPKR